MHELKISPIRPAWSPSLEPVTPAVAPAPTVAQQQQQQSPHGELSFSSAIKYVRTTPAGPYYSPLRTVTVSDQATQTPPHGVPVPVPVPIVVASSTVSTTTGAVPSSPATVAEGSDASTTRDKRLEAALVSLLGKMLDVEKDCEDLRKRLAVHPSFNLIDAFNTLDADGNGYISQEELRAFMETNGCFVSAQELRLLSRILDHRGEGRISYAEFIRKLMPKDDKYSELVTSRHASRTQHSPSHPKQQRSLSISATHDLARALKRFVALEMEVQEARRTLTQRTEFSIHRTLALLDKDNTGEVGAHQLRALLVRYDVIPTETALAALMGRFDKHHRGRLSYLDLLDEITQANGDTAKPNA